MEITKHREAYDALTSEVEELRRRANEIEAVARRLYDLFDLAKGKEDRGFDNLLPPRPNSDEWCGYLPADTSTGTLLEWYMYANPKPLTSTQLLEVRFVFHGRERGLVQWGLEARLHSALQTLHKANRIKRERAPAELLSGKTRWVWSLSSAQREIMNTINKAAK
jgi:hypothetical protein